LAAHRNLGKAFYENPTTQEQAVAEFRAARAIAPDSTREKLNYALALLRSQGHEDEAVKLLEEVQKQDPSLPHTWFNLGIVFKRRGDIQRAIQQFEGMITRAPSEAVGHFQLGSLYRQTGRNADALAQFTKAADLNPQMAAARFQLYDMSRRSGNPAATAKYLADFERVKAIQKTWIIPEDVEWSEDAEIYDPPEVRAESPSPERHFAGAQTIAKVEPATAGITTIDLNGDGQTDLLVWSSSGISIFSRGHELVSRSGLEDVKGVVYVAPGDFDNDGLMDLCVITDAGPHLYKNGGGHFETAPARLPPHRFGSAVWVDFDHDYDLDLMLLGPEPLLLRNQGAAGWADVTPDFPFVKGDATFGQMLRIARDSKAFDIAVAFEGRAPVVYRDRLGGRYDVEEYKGPPLTRQTQIDADFRSSGLIDRVRIDADGTIQYLAGLPNTDRWIRIQLKGVRSPKLAQGAQVEIKSGTLYRRAFYDGVPLTFDTGGHAVIDVVRITWPNGLIQNEVRRQTDQKHVIEEAQRLSGSCPMVWTWNGREFQFITDVLGVAPLGARNADGRYFPVNHREFVQIPGAALQPKNGLYEVRVTEELSEVSYLDQIQLYSVDHPANTEIFTNEKFKSPPFPEFRLFEVTRRIYPKAAHTGSGEDVLPVILAKDQRYPTGFQRSETGVAELHTLELDFGEGVPGSRANLLLNGWVDWPDGSTFRRASQESVAGLVMPYLQVQDSRGRWQTIDSDMGMPAGKPKTIAVPVKFLSSKRRIRIVTNLCVYWDQVFLTDDPATSASRPEQVELASATLKFRGFSASKIDRHRTQPDIFAYTPVSPASFWNPTPGLYTKYGRVDALLGEVDDRMVIMGSGDELQLSFRVAPPKPGWIRDYLLRVDGWAKDSDPNTAFSETVGPLPFHAMSSYPYPPSEHYPADSAHIRYQQSWNTRLAATPIGLAGTPVHRLGESLK
jgi:hypothetical protein